MSCLKLDWVRNFFNKFIHGFEMILIQYDIFLDLGLLEISVCTSNSTELLSVLSLAKFTLLTERFFAFNPKNF